MEWSDLDLSGHVAIVTGGGRGLGRHFTLELAGAGASVAVVGRTIETLNSVCDEAQARGVAARAFVADVRDADAATTVVAAVEEDLGPPTVLVNNAGVAHVGLGPVASLDVDEFWDVMAINVRGPLLWTRAALPGMLARRSGRIINITSGAGKAPVPNGSAYCVSKAALSHFTAVLGAELDGSGVVTFALAPVAATDGLRELATAPGLTEAQHGMFATLYQLAEDTLMADSLRLFRTALSGTIDHASGAHLDSTRPLAEQIATR